MFVVGECVDGGYAGEFCEIDHILLGEGADDGAVDHASEDAGGVFDRFSAAELDIVFREEHRESAKFADADFEGDAGAGGGFGENHGPRLSGKLFAIPAALAFQDFGGVDQVGDLCSGQLFDGEEMVHGRCKT